MEYQISTDGNKIVQEIKINEISQKNFNPRKNGLIEDNISSLLETEYFPEIHLGLLNGELIVVDGYHRLEASKRLGLETIKAFITPYTKIEGLQKDAINENINHGQRLTDYDIAVSIFDIYKSFVSQGKLSSLTIIEFIRMFKIDDRRGRSLFAWAVMHKEVLEDDVKKVEKASFMEEYYSLIKHFKEAPGALSNEFKYKLKNFYYRYCELNRTQLREAVNLFKEGKDYEEEQTKKRKEEIALNEKVITESQNIVTNSSSEEKEETISKEISREIAPKNDLLKNVESKSFEEKMNEVNDEIKNEIEEKSKTSQKVGVKSYLENISSQLMTLIMLQTKGKLEPLTKEHIDLINNIEDRFDEITQDYYKELNKKVI